MQQLEIIYQDDHILVVNKPHGLLMHRSKIAKDATTSVLKILRAQTGLKLYPVHRLDRKTSGVLIVALNPVTQSYLNRQFEERKVIKSYHAIVRGYTEESGTIDYAIKSDKGIVKEAVTHFRKLKQFELPWPLGKHATSRYSLMELSPETGRYHQLRMHMAHIFHPIIGDRPHGCNKQNRYWKEKHQMSTMFLHAYSIGFALEKDSPALKFQAPYSSEFIKALELLGHKKRDIVQHDKGQ